MKLLLLLTLFTSLAFSKEIVYKVYDFSELQSKLNYPNESYFGSSLEEISDLLTYTTKEDNYYKDINAYLRNFPSLKYDWYSISPIESKKITKSMDNILGRTPTLPEDLILFRGTDLKYRNSKSFEKGEEFIEKGYASTSTSFEIADYFANKINNNANTSSKKAILVLYSTVPTLKGILIDETEDEVILSHGLKIKIMEVDKSKKYDMYLAQICSSVCEEQTNKSANMEFLKLIKR